MRVLECIDKTKRRIYLTSERWSHLSGEHPEVVPYLNQFEEVLKQPLQITSFTGDTTVAYYYKHAKDRPCASKHLLLVVKYLNGEGFIITGYFVKKLK
ncbi:hypothetical protein HY489_00860 [Candidatus Woesearchaeota archaeon]|nr:hypothetical protein [Candidatus Woesearchaeota archaeon]